MENVGLYVHVPFCSGKCFYCDFYSIPAQQQLVDDYLRALAKEAELIRRSYFNDQKPVLETIYIGGGTPTSLEPHQLASLVQIIADNFSQTATCEFTSEANPESVTGEKFCVLKEGGMNRVSIGVQTFDDELLKKIGRRHSAQQVTWAVEMALEQQIGNIGLDLIFALPEQTALDFRSDLSAAIRLMPEHLSCYELTYEPGTPLYELRPDPIDVKAEEQQVEMYYAAHEFLTSQGFDHYEISNYARPGFQCRHNIRYWKNLDYIGLGASAAGFLHRKRYKNISSIADYCRDVLEHGKLPIESEETLTNIKFAGETAMLALRTMAGIDKNEFSARTGYDPFALFENQIEKFVRLGLLETRDHHIALTAKGLPLANEVLGDFLL